MGRRRIAETGIDGKDALRTVGCAAALALILVASSLCSRHVTDLLEVRLFLPQGLHLLLGFAWYALLSLVAYHKLPLLGSPAASGLAEGLAVTFAVLMAYGSGMGSAPAAIAGAALYELVEVWACLLLACCLAALPDLKLAAIAVVGGVIARQAALPLYATSMSAQAGFAAMAVLLDAAIALLAAIGAPQLRNLRRRETMGGLELTNPLSSLWPSLRVFVCAFLVPLTYNFANALGVPGLSVRRAAVVLVLLALLWVLLVQRSEQEDRLFSFVVMFVMAGLMVTPLVLEGDTFIAHTLLFLGSSCFTILLWLLVYGLGSRNMASMVPFFGLAMGLGMLGRFIGGAIAVHTIGTPDADPYLVQAVVLGLAFAFFMFIWLGLRTFSFTAAIRGVEKTEALEVPPWATAAQSGLDDGAAGADRFVAERRTPGIEEPPSGAPPYVDEASEPGLSGAADRPSRPPAVADTLDRRCDRLARKAALTPREREVLGFLAHGRNAQFLMKELCITRNTAKAHISHIYTKLGVHSHQELLSLVERGQ